MVIWNYIWLYGYMELYMELYGTIYMVIWGSIMWMINHDNPLSWWWEVSAAAYHCCILIYPGTFYGQRQPLAFEPPQGISSLNCVRTSSWSLSNSSCGSKVMHHHENHWGTHFVKFETHIQSMQPKKKDHVALWHVPKDPKDRVYSATPFHLKAS